MIHRYIGMMTIISTDMDWIKIDDFFSEFVEHYYNDKKFTNRIIELYKYYQLNDKYNDYCKFLEKIIKKAIISKDGIKTKRIIKILENKIYNLISINPTIKLNTKYFNKKTPKYIELNKDNKYTNITLSQINYYDLLDCIDDINVRHKIENQYNSRTRLTLPIFAKLILQRKKLAEQFKYPTFFKYLSRDKHDNSETIKDLIVELNKKIEIRVNDEISKIFNYYSRVNGTPDKLSMSDIIKYNRLHKNKNLFFPNHVLNVLFNILDNYFFIKIESTTEKTWSDNVIMYNMKDSGTGVLLGRLFIDILKNDHKSVSDPISVRLSDKMQINDNEYSIAEVALIASYTSDKCMSYDDIVLLFKEFGYIIHNVCYDSRVGLVNYDDEFTNYLPLLMEYIAWDRKTIESINSDNDPTIIDHIEISRYVDMCFTLKLRCINAKFDHLMHNSDRLINMIAHAAEINNNDASDFILTTYQNIYKESFKPISNMMIDDVDFIDPLVMIQEINNSQGLLYAHLMNEILAFATFWIISHNKNKDFRNNVLSNGVDNYRELVRSFLQNIDTDYFTLYIQNVIKSDVLDVVTDDTNYFDDNESGDSDKEEIIQIKRI